MARVHHVVVAALPLAVAAGLLWVGLFVEPSPTASPAEPPVIAQRDRFYGYAIVDNGGIWAVGSGGNIVRSSPAPEGAWRRQKSGVETDLQAIDAWDAQRAVAVGNDGVVIVTHDGGENWRLAQAPKSGIADKLVRVRALPGGAALAVGEYTAVLRAEDFGASWRRLTPEHDVAWYGFDLAGSVLVVVGEFGRVLRSADQGKSWQAIQTPVKAHLTAVAFRHRDEALAVGLNGTVLRSLDAGRTWRLAPAQFDEHIYDVIWDGARYVACGERGLLIASPDGLRWAVLASELGDARNRLWFTQIRQYGSGYLVAGARLALVDAARIHDLTPAPPAALARTGFAP